MSISEELQRLNQLRESGALSEEEYERAKAEALRGTGAVGSTGGIPNFGMNDRQWGMVLHFSQFTGYCVPVLGFLLPIVIWQLKKDEFPVLDEHGKIVVNWLLSALIYMVVCSALVFVVIGVLGFMVLGVLAIIFPIIGGIKANNGRVWQYPFSIQFFK